ncbi:hypothetical protein CC78DRAFT_528339 [Lojkania enalia]|uniref:Uncharacterized protein n=1 Tax=Lojkania enalia TaxID=147567 RepID=A0A9P4TRQ4_9PLEO|nr:hypothetical protein CC78DRAFT_528339 [Didymosphaeria enalia]
MMRNGTEARRLAVPARVAFVMVGLRLAEMASLKSPRTRTPPHGFENETAMECIISSPENNEQPMVGDPSIESSIAQGVTSQNVIP